ncbi:KAT8 regulatory NSL complex subunit 1 isoform X1 [Astyanax mexicanus]|uniref:KAT8 regulatory NSL complex subunit 1 isoform X1 n=1 Tax=Astyanax mexicanus TaxID=7994 RepID=UPI000BBDB4D6|nr:KAT8 regulatory NSL complex subunit 1 isoform X1 [Astyanax mexicanus]XP_049332060.1 KAT8 regulatory NSL complex subunit 1 isoform X1 [Astyanax mexicanus]
MAAMAPALTDAPAEAHRIRFKLAPPSSTLSPSGVEGNGGTSHILVSSNGNVKCKASEERPLRGPVTCKREESARGDTPQAHLGKLQPLVTSYRCSDVMSVHSPKESLKMQGVLLQNHGILPTYLPRKHQALEEQFKSIMSGGTGGGPFGLPSLQDTPVNGMAKKWSKPGPDNNVNLNGGKHAGQDTTAQTPIVASRGGLIGNGPLRDSIEHQCPRDISQGHASNPKSSFLPPNAPSDLDEDKVSDTLPSLTTDFLVTFPAACQYPLGSLGAELRDRTQQSQSRQSEIEGRLQRLHKRLQVVQAKQVERHVQQQLGGLLRSTLAPLDALRQQQGRHSTEPLVPQERDRLNRVLRAGSVPAELERLSISGSTNLRSAEGAFDSDATESSSGGETDVEENELARVDIEQRHIPLSALTQLDHLITTAVETVMERAGIRLKRMLDRLVAEVLRWRRAEGRFAVDRASIISHWNWLQAHVSDLEYRIRQQTDIYRQIRTNKGPVLLGESSVCESSGEECSVSRTNSITWPALQVRTGDGTEGSVSANGIAIEMNPRKGYPPVRQVNGVINSLQASSPESAELEDLLTSQQQRPGSAPDITCAAARTRPLLSCKRRRLLRPSSVTILNRRIQNLAGPGRCGCEVSGQCVMCCGRSLAPVDPQLQLPLLDRLAQFDPCIHPILSFPDDVGISLHLQRLLKCHWQGRPLEKIKPIKKMSLKHKLPLSSHLPDPSSSSPSKEKYKLNNSLLSTVRLSLHKSRSEKLLRQQSDGSESRQLFRTELTHATFNKSHSRKRPREYSQERTENAPKLYVEMSSPCSSQPSLNTPSHSPLVRQLSSSESPTPCSLNNATPQPIRRRRGESSFDINNIVIPMSVAATTRVEKLQYKEILTPSWREVDITARKIFKEDDSVEIEDLSDAVFSQLHLPYEEQERSRWSWTASAIAKRRGSRSYKSVDGRTTPLLSGTNPSTPQPSSPDTAHFHLLQDYGSAASPSSPASPELLMISGLHTPGLRDSHRLLSNEDTRCSTPDTIYEEMPVQPWERRAFPLDVDPELDFEDQISPASDRPGRSMRRISGCKTSSSRSDSDAGPPSPLPEDSSKQKASPLKHLHQ